jgi:signal peptide peptidase SppA
MPRDKSTIDSRQSTIGFVMGADERGLRDGLMRLAQARLAAGSGPLADIPLLRGQGLFSSATPAVTISRGVAVIDVVGPLSKASGLYNWIFGTLTYGQLAEQLEQAAAEVRVQSVLLRIDSPGGTVAGVSDLCDAIARCRARKSVLAAISDLGASCAYQVAACCERIAIDRDGLAGSIGTFLVVEDLSQMYLDVGVKVQVFATQQDPYKGAGTPGTPITEPQANEFQRLADEMGTEMIRSIYAARPALRTSSLKLPDGRCYLGADAVARGLADEVASWPELLERLQGGGSR